MTGFGERYSSLQSLGLLKLLVEGHSLQTSNEIFPQCYQLLAVLSNKCFFHAQIMGKKAPKSKISLKGTSKVSDENSSDVGDFGGL